MILSKTVWLVSIAFCSFTVVADSDKTTPAAATAPTTATPSGDADTDDPRSRLYEHISKTVFGMTTRPQSYSTLDIFTSFQLNFVNYVNEKTGIVDVMGFLTVEWVENRMQWMPSDYGNITNITETHLPLWFPIFNSNAFSEYSFTLGKVRLLNNGAVTALYHFYEQIPCQFDLTNFPKDKQVCNVFIFPKTDTGLNLRLSQPSKGSQDLVDSTKFLGPIFKANHHMSWTIQSVNLSVETVNVPPFSTSMLKAAISMQRHSFYYMRIYVTPVCFLLLLTPIIFLLPPDSTEKLTYGAILLFAMVYVSGSVDSIFPPYTDTMPYLVRLTTASGALLFLSVFLTSIISSVERVGREKPIHPWVRRNILGKLGPALFVHERGSERDGAVHIKTLSENEAVVINQDEPSGLTEIDESDPTLTNRPENAALMMLVKELRKSRLQKASNEEWTNLFTIINRLLFLSFLLMAVIVILCFTG